MAKAGNAPHTSPAGYLGADPDIVIRSGDRVVIITDCEGAALIGAGLEILSPDDPQDEGRQDRAGIFAARVLAAAA